MKNKLGISPLIGYILLIAGLLAISVLVYAWLKTYIPKESLECPSTTSIFISDYNCTTNNLLNVTIKNNGNFNIAGYFIRISNTSGQDIATIDLSSKLDKDEGGEIFGNSILLSSSETENSLSPEEKSSNIFNITNYNTIYFVELTPIRFQTESNKQRTVSCANAKIKEELTCT